MENENLKQNIENPPLAKPEKEKLFNENLKPLRTYQGDVEKIISEKHVSVATVAVAEQKRKVVEQEKGINVEYSNIKNRIFIYLGIFLLFSGVVIVGSFYFVKSKSSSSTNIEAQTTIINYRNKIDTTLGSMSRVELIQQIVKEKNNYTGKLNNVLYINFNDNKGVATIQDILSRISPYIPQALSRSLDKNYMFGVYSYDKNQIFIILTTKDYGATFSGMLKWEKGMVSDIGEIFDIPAGTSKLSAFVDESVENKDLRVVKDEKGKTILLYSFIDKNTVVITTNEQILTHVFDKFINSKMVR